MKVHEIMTSDVGSCGLETDLAAAATIMWERDCGAVPVLDGERQVVGIITDRDICMAVATRNRLAADITVSEVVSGAVRSCAAEDDVERALEIMAQERLRRLPVIGSNGTLLGMLSINDAVLQTQRGNGRRSRHLSRKRVLRTLRAICEHQATRAGGEAVSQAAAMV